MPTFTPAPAAVLGTVVLLAALAGTAGAQIQLPRATVGREAPVPAQTGPAGAGSSQAGAPSGPTQQGPTGQGPTRQGRDEGSGLVLPTSLPRREPAGAGGSGTRSESGVPLEPGAGPGAGALPVEVAPGTAAIEFALAEVAKLAPESVNDPLIARSEHTLVVAGEPGLHPARRALHSEHPPTVVLGARVLLRSGLAAEAGLVATRLADRLPRHAGPPLVEAVEELDPVRASPAFLAALLGHPQSAVRAAAHRRLERLPPGELLEALRPELEDDQTDTRLRAVQLVSSVKDPAVLPLLLGRLGDRSSTVAARAMASLAVIDDARVDQELLGRAFGMRWILRDAAYALLTIVEREDRQLQSVLTDVHVEPLLEGLGSSDVFVAGACAAALAGIGFRSELEAGEWLDRTVPHRLVRTVGGVDFHNDYSALQPVALRRLTLITGEQLGSDGPRWLRWWADHAAGFHARRAVLRAAPEDAGRLRVTVRSTGGLSAGGLSTGFQLLGPEVEQAADEDLEVQPVRITGAQARELFAVLDEQGVLGAGRLPGLRGSDEGGTQALVVAVDGQEKVFRFAPGREELWFDSVLATAEAIRDQNRWQHFLATPETEPAARRALWELEAAWWEAEADEHTRGLRLKQLVLEHLGASKPSQRDAAAAELARLGTRPELIEAADFAPLLALLRAEPFMGPRARTFVRLALEAARRAHAAAPVLDEGEGLPVPPAGRSAEREALASPELARELVDVLLAGFGPEAARELSAVLAAAGPEATRAAASDTRAFVRAVAASTLADDPSEEDWEVLERLLVDPDEGVQLATIRALGAHRVEAARTELLVRARVGLPAVRSAALEAVGQLGGEGAFDALLVGLAERDDPEVGVAAARGLRELGDARAAPLFVSILARGEQHPAFDPAREGLVRLGPAAREALLRVVHTSKHPARREAALILSRQGVPAVASTLMSILTEDPADTRVAAELAVLTCVDQRGKSDPAVAWWTWWDGVLHDDAGAWLVAASERIGLAPPTPEERAAGSRGTALWLLELLQRPEEYLAERGRRELEGLLAAAEPEDEDREAGSPLGELPVDHAARQEWLAAVRLRIDAHYE